MLSFFYLSRIKKKRMKKYNRVKTRQTFSVMIKEEDF